MKSSYPCPGTRKHLCGRFNRFLLVVLLSVLSLPAVCLQGAEVSDQTYEFVLNDVAYTCYGLNDYGEIRVKAQPASSDVRAVSIQLYFPDLQQYVSGADNITQGSPTELSGDVWQECENLKTIEFITGVDSDYHHYAVDYSTDISILEKCPNLRNIIVTGDWSFWVFTKIPLGKYYSYYTDGVTLHKEKYNTQQTIKTTHVSEILKKLVYEADLRPYTYYVESYGLTPVVELQAVRRDVPYTSQWYPMEYDETGTPAVKLIGDLNYRVTARELHGLKNPWAEGGVHQYGESLFRQCFDNLYRGTERMLCPKPQKLSNNGLELIRITNDNDNEKQPASDGNYHLPFGNYHIELKSGGIPMCYKFNAQNKSTAEINVESVAWTPNSLYMRISSVSGDSFGDDAVLGLGEVKNDEIIQFAPFDQIRTARLYSENNIFHIYRKTYPKTKYNAERDVWYWSPGFNAAICVKIGENVFNIQNYSIGEDIQTREGSIFYQGDCITLGFYNLLDKLPSGNKEAGVIADGRRFPVDKSTNSADMIDLRPETVYPVQVYYKMNGKEYTSNPLDLKTREISVYVSSLTKEVQSVTVGYGVNNISHRTGHMEYRDVKAVTDLSKTYYPVSPKGSRFTFSELPPGADVTIMCQPYYVSDSGWEVKIGNRIETKTSLTAPLWHNGTSEALTTTRARLKYSTNIGNVNDTYVEWRRVDAPAVVQSSKAMCPVIDGTLVGILNNLNPDVYYQFRPVYEYSSKKYYGEWVGIFTGDANVWFDPEITTSPARVSEDGTVTLRGAVLPGSGDVSEQGFEIWPVTDASYAHEYNSERVDASHRFISCDGISMAVEVSDLPAGTTYAYRTYAKVGTKSYTGSEMTFTTPGTGGIGQTTADAAEPEIVGYYNLQGVRSDRPMPGLNIVVYSNGTTEKRIFRDI